MSTAPALDVRDHIAVWTQALKAEIGTDHVYLYGELDDRADPSDLPEIYLLLAIGRRFIENNRMVGRVSRSSWRTTVRWVGRDEIEARWAERRVSAIEGRHLEIAGFTSTPIYHESSTDPEPDKGRTSGLTTYRYTL